MCVCVCRVCVCVCRVCVCVCVQGAQEVFKQLPHEFVSLESLQKVRDYGGNKHFTFEVENN